METAVSFNSLCSCIDVDRDFLEVLLPYIDKLTVMGIDLNDLPLQQAIEGHVVHLESACRAIIGYAGWRAYHGERFSSKNHATRCFVKALTEKWEPHEKWEHYVQFVSQSRYLSAYERARRLIHELNCLDSFRTWNAGMLEPLADEEIEEMIPELEEKLYSLK